MKERGREKISKKKHMHSSTVFPYIWVSTADEMHKGTYEDVF
jgi:hypothetical protein